MNGTYLIRSVGILSCLAVMASGWDAEAGWRHRRSGCCEPVCCEPVCCEPVYCEPVRYEPVCCGTVRKTTCCEPVRETSCCGTVVVTPVRSCCSDSFVITGQDGQSQLVSVATKEAGQRVASTGRTQATSVSLNRPAQR